VDAVVGGAGEEDVGVDARELLGLADPAEDVLVGLGLPELGPRTRCTTRR
jgi:hypothetical protein